MDSSPDHLDDEVLSTLLDGDAGDRTAHDLGAADAGAHVRACDRCRRRQAELAAARTALATASVEPVDELTRRRLVAAALLAAAGEHAISEPAAPGRSARSRWLARHPALVGSAAAVILGVLVGVPFVMGDDNPSREAGTSLAAGDPEASRQPAGGTYLGDLGDLSDREKLRQRLVVRQAGDAYAYAPMEPGASPAGGGRPAPAPVPSAAPSGGGLASTTTAPSAAMPASGRSSGAAETADKAAGDTVAGAATSDSGAATSGRDRADTDACVAALLNGPARGGRLEAAGTGSFEGRPATVAVFELSGGRVAFVTDRAGCAVLDRFAV